MIPSSEVLRLPRACSSILLRHIDGSVMLRHLPSATSSQFTQVESKVRCTRCGKDMSAFIATTVELWALVWKERRFLRLVEVAHVGVQSSYNGRILDALAGKTYIDVAHVDSARHICDYRPKKREVRKVRRR